MRQRPAPPRRWHRTGARPGPAARPRPRPASGQGAAAGRATARPDRVGEAQQLYSSSIRIPPTGGRSGRTRACRPAEGRLRQALRRAETAPVGGTGLVGNPRIAILDELTTGLDPQARRDTWQVCVTFATAGTPSCWSPTSWTKPNGSATGSPSCGPARSSPSTPGRARRRCRGPGRGPPHSRGRRPRPHQRSRRLKDEVHHVVRVHAHRSQTTGLATAGRRVATALARLSWMEAKLFLREPLGGSSPSRSRRCSC